MWLQTLFNNKSESLPKRIKSKYCSSVSPIGTIKEVFLCSLILKNLLILFGMSFSHISLSYFYLPSFSFYNSFFHFHILSFRREIIKSGYTSCGSLHGGKEQLDRDFTLKIFKSGEMKILVATSVAARGLDVPSIRCVVNFDCPNHLEDYGIISFHLFFSFLFSFYFSLYFFLNYYLLFFSTSMWTYRTCWYDRYCDHVSHSFRRTILS